MGIPSKTRILAIIGTMVVIALLVFSGLCQVGKHDHLEQHNSQSNHHFYHSQHHKHDHCQDDNHKHSHEHHPNRTLWRFKSLAAHFPG